MSNPGRSASGPFSPARAKIVSRVSCSPAAPRRAFPPALEPCPEPWPVVGYDPRHEPQLQSPPRIERRTQQNEFGSRDVSCLSRSQITRSQLRRQSQIDKWHLKFGVSAAYTKSKCSSMVVPPPTAAPCTAATSGLLKLISASAKRACGLPAAFGGFFSKSPRSLPAVKESPAPCNTTTRSSSCLSASRYTWRPSSRFSWRAIHLHAQDAS